MYKEQREISNQND